jgi:hypothetical protein
VGQERVEVGGQVGGWVGGCREAKQMGRGWHQVVFRRPASGMQGQVAVADACPPAEVARNRAHAAAAAVGEAGPRPGGTHRKHKTVDGLEQPV